MKYDEVEFETELLAKISLRGTIPADWKTSCKILKSIVRDFSYPGVKITMRFIEKLTTSSDEYVTTKSMEEKWQGSGEDASRVSKRLRSLCRALNLEESRESGTGFCSFRVNSEVKGSFFECMEGVFEEIHEMPLSVYLSSKNPEFKQFKKRRKNKIDSAFAADEIPKEFAVEGYDEEGRPLLRKKTLMELHQDGVYNDESRKNAEEAMKRQKEGAIQWGDVAPKRSKLEKSEPDDEWNRTRFDRDAIMGGSTAALGKSEAQLMASTLAKGTGGRFDSGGVAKSFL